MVTKKEFRVHFLHLREKYKDINVNSALSRMIEKKIFDYLNTFNSSNTEIDLLTYYPTNTEVNLAPLHKTLLNNNKALYFPRVEKTGLAFYKCNSLSSFTASHFNIMEPPSHYALYIPNNDHNAIALIPGLGFGENAERLGFGKGYYDKYLNHFKGKKIGICFDEFLVENLPVTEHDIPMDIIITEKRTLYFNPR